MICTEGQELPAWSAHQDCVLCGHDHPFGLRLHFQKVSESSIQGHWTVLAEYQGYNGLLQGGITAAILDSAMVNCLRLLGIEAKTAEMNIRYQKAIPMGCVLTIQAKVDSSRKRLHFTSAEIQSEGVLYASANAKFLSE